ncbi:MAG: hypothetical protein L0219_08170, partial [Phycisphaerales bacterium]|nr:hypothetical protein [Phycisphaerales bacterium]
MSIKRSPYRVRCRVNRSCLAVAILAFAAGLSLADQVEDNLRKGGIGLDNKSVVGTARPSGTLASLAEASKAYA